MQRMFGDFPVKRFKLGLFKRRATSPTGALHQPSLVAPILILILESCRGWYGGWGGVELRERRELRELRLECFSLKQDFQLLWG